VERLWNVPSYAIATLLVAGPVAAYFHILPPLAGFSLIVLAVIASMVFGIGLAAASGFATVTNKPWRQRAVRGAVLPLAVALSVLMLLSFSKVPMIHDISTDVEDRLEFTPDVAAQSMNKDPEPDVRADVEAKQRAGYPDIAPVRLSSAPAEAFARAKTTADAMPGWLVTAADSESGRIEATATSKLFHFVDDIVIRVRPDPIGARIDMRSRSRVGQGDMGANAARIRAYFEALNKH
jgi:uncharacterized protein (DUF1499 family)